MIHLFHLFDTSVSDYVEKHILLFKVFRQETPQALRLDCAYLVKELDITCVMAHQHEAPTVTTELLTLLT